MAAGGRYQMDMYEMNNIVIVGFEEATITRDFCNLIAQAHTVNVLHPDDFLVGRHSTDSKFLISVTRDKNLRQALIEYLDAHNLQRATYIHPSALVNPHAMISDGVFIGPFASVFNQAKVHKDCIIGPYSMVSHSASLGQGSIMHPGSMIAGSTNVGQSCLLGMRSTIIDKLEICNNVIIGAGSLVNKNILEPGNYVGSPARRVK
jgi:sugar O-acyltransferase (sialic acid O-acetyltransferase NeuD family)